MLNSKDILNLALTRKAQYENTVNNVVESYLKQFAFSAEHHGHLETTLVIDNYAYADVVSKLVSLGFEVTEIGLPGDQKYRIQWRNAANNNSNTEGNNNG